MENWIRAAAIRLRDRDPSHRKPKAPAVRVELEAYLKITPSDTTQPDGSKLSENYEVPGDTAIRDRLREKKGVFVFPTLDEDIPWSLGVSGANDIPDDATAACLTIWATVAKGDTGGGVFSVRHAKWVSRLRWVEKAGGSATGEVRNPLLLYAWAVRYSGRARISTAVNAPMESGNLDAFLMLEPDAIRAGMLAGNIPRYGLSDREEELGVGDPKLSAFIEELREYYLKEGTDATQE